MQVTPAMSESKVPAPVAPEVELASNGDDVESGASEPSPASLALTDAPVDETIPAADLTASADTEGDPLLDTEGV